MPRLLKTVEQHIRLFLTDSSEGGALKSAARAALLPYRIVRKYRQSVANNPGVAVSDEFDIEHGIETSVKVHTTDLDIASPNWIHAAPYWPTPSSFLAGTLSGLDLHYEDFTFIDLGSGKGRVLLMASEFPFRRILGVELSTELHAVAQRNIQGYQGTGQRCRDIASLCMDFTKFEFPDEPLFLFLYNPASRHLTEILAKNIMRSLEQRERPVWILYVTPQDVFDSEPKLHKVKSGECSGHPYYLYTNTPTTSAAAA
jgi:SAM-dependent methyltransferase